MKWNDEVEIILSHLDKVTNWLECAFKVLVQHQYPGSSRNEGVAHGLLSPIESHGT